MSKRYDAVSKRLIERRPEDWVDFLGLPSGPVSLVDADLSTISAAADRIVRVDAATPYLMHNELESGKDTATFPDDLMHYNALVDKKFRLPTVSTVFLLHKASNSRHMTGHLQRRWPDGTEYLSFRYNIIRVWEIEPKRFLTGGIALLPFTPISKVEETELPKIIETMEARIEAEAADSEEAAELWVATNVLMGLRYNAVFKQQLLRGIRRMRESITYQEILEEGRQEGLQEGRQEGLQEGRQEGLQEGELVEARRILLRFAIRRLGMIPPATEARLLQITSLPVLEALLDRVIAVETWEELLNDVPNEA